MNEYSRLLAKLRSGSYEPKNSRSLGAVADGIVFPVGELFSENGRVRGEGYAVRPKSGLFVRGVTLSAPDNAVVTDISEREGTIKLRNGDGIALEVVVGLTDVKWNTAVGCKLRRGDVICTLMRSDAEQNELSGAFAVLFSAPEQITELHIPSAKRRAGEAAAFYRVR